MLDIARRLDIAVLDVAASGGRADKGTVRQCQVVVFDSTEAASLAGRKEAIHGNHEATEAMTLALQGGADRAESSVGQGLGVQLGFHHAG